MIRSWRHRPEVWLLGGIFATGLFLLAFGLIAEEVVEGEATKLDQTVLLALRSAEDPCDPIGSLWFQEGARDVTSLGSYAVLGIVFFAVVAYLLMTQKRSAAIYIAAAVIGGVLLSNALKYGFDRPRPESLCAAIRASTPSFPSGHAMLSAITFLSLGALLARLTSSFRQKVFFLAVAIFLSVIIGLSRVYLGVHYPTDVLAGWSVGAAWAALCWTVARGLQQRGSIEPATAQMDESA